MIDETDDQGVPRGEGMNNIKKVTQMSEIVQVDEDSKNAAEAII